MPAEELTAVSDLRYSWRKLLDLAVTVSDNLSQLQVVPRRPPCMLFLLHLYTVCNVITQVGMQSHAQCLGNKFFER